MQLFLETHIDFLSIRKTALVVWSAVMFYVGFRRFQKRFT